MPHFVLNYNDKPPRTKPTITKAKITKYTIRQFLLHVFANDHATIKARPVKIKSATKTKIPNSTFKNPKM